MTRASNWKPAEGAGRYRPAPTDAAADAAFARIAKIAREHGLVAQGYGGVLTIATPEAQRDAGIREKVLRMHLMEETP